MTAGDTFLPALQRLIATHFSRDELADLCLLLGIRFDTLTDAGLMTQTHELILALARQERLPQLLAALRAEQPHVDWPPLPDDFQLPAPLAAPPPARGDINVGTAKAKNLIIGNDGRQTINNIEMSGDFRGAILNIQSTLRDVRQSVEAMPAADHDVRAELIRLVGQLDKAMQRIPPGQEDKAADVADTTKALVDAAGAEKPNKAAIRALGDGLKAAAARLYEELPALVDIAAGIAAVVASITG